MFTGLMCLSRVCVVSPASHEHRGVLRYNIVDGAAWEYSTRSFVRVLCILPGSVLYLHISCHI